MSQFKRRASVSILTPDKELVIEGLRITFRVEKSVLPQFNKSDIEIYNLSKDTRDKIEDVNQQAVLNVGYDAPDKSLTKIAKGDILRYKHLFDTPNIVTKLELREGKIAEDTPLSFTGKENESFYNALKKVAKEAKMEIDFKGTTITELKNKLMSAGYAFNGRLKHAMDELANSVDVNWSISDEKLLLIAKGGYIPGGTIIFLDETCGLIGVPEKIDDVTVNSGKQKKKNRDLKAVSPGYIITSLLNPLINPGNVLHIKSKKLEIDSECVVHDVSHSGDTHGAEWISRTKVILKK